MFESVDEVLSTTYLLQDKYKSSLGLCSFELCDWENGFFSMEVFMDILVYSGAGFYGG